MTTARCVTAVILTLTLTPPVMAQVPVAPAAPPAVPSSAPVPPAAPAPPALPPPAVRPDFTAADVHVLRPDSHVDWPDVVWPEFDPADLRALTESAHLIAAEAKALMQIAPGTSKGPSTPLPFVNTGKVVDDSLYNQARLHIDHDRYDRALEALDRLIANRGARSEAAMYWKAYSQLKLARHAEALATLADMRKQFPTSSWVRDAAALEVEVRQAAGQSVNAEAQTSEDLKLLALHGIMRSDPETAIPVIEKTLAGNSSVRVKERALFVLSQSRVPRARSALIATARNASNPDLRLAAIRYLGRMSTPESQQTLEEMYRSTADEEIKRAILQALAGDKNASATLVALARAEKNQALKTEIVRRLSTINTPEARDYLMELLK